MSFTVDASEITAFAAQCERAAAAVPQVLHEAGMSAGLIVQGRAMINAQAMSKSGTNANSIGPPEVSMGGDAIRVEVAAKAVSLAGFPYPWVLEHGRGPIVPVRAKVLAFEVGGKKVFAKRVGPAAARPFMKPALDASQADIEATVEDAVDKLFAMVGA